MDGNANMNNNVIIEMLIKYKYDFKKLVNVGNNVRYQTPLMILCRYPNSLEPTKQLMQHCQSFIDITQCNVHGENALFYAALSDFDTFSYLLCNVCFPDADTSNKIGQMALNQKDIFGNTVAAIAVKFAMPHSIDTLKLLRKLNFNFNIYDNYGKLVIHNACTSNQHLILSWMIDENIFDNNINCLTKYAKDKKNNGFTPLDEAVSNNSVECVNVLCKHENINITRNNIDTAMANDNLAILRLLICGLFTKWKISSWHDIERQDKVSLISSNGIGSLLSQTDSTSGESCHIFLKQLYYNGYLPQNYAFIVFTLDYNVKTIVNGEKNLIKSTQKLFDQYQIKDDLGEGSFGLVKLATDKNTKKNVAIKYIDISKKNTPIQFIASEIESLKKMSTHPYIIDLLKYQIDLSNKDYQVLLCFEYCENGELHQLLQQCDHFSMRISFKYFCQLLSAITACHKMNIVHRDLKLENILLSDTFQAKIADFGLASIARTNTSNSNYNYNNSDEKTASEYKNNTTDFDEKIYNVGTPLYKSPELLEYTTNFDIEDLRVLKACDVFSLSIIFWQMMNSVKYFPFKLCKTINHGNYKYIKCKQFGKFWNIHRRCNMIMNGGFNDTDLLFNLFESMFEYNPLKRITCDQILQHKWYLHHSNDLLFKMNDFELESFVRPISHQIQHQQPAVSSFVPASAVTGYYNYQSTLQKNSTLSSVAPTQCVTSGVGSWLAKDSSEAALYKDDRHRSINQDQNKSSRTTASILVPTEHKILMVLKPLVVILGIGEYVNKFLGAKFGVLNDYINVKTMLHDLKQFDIVYQNAKKETVHHKKMDLQQKTKKCKESIIKVEKEFAIKWTSDEFVQFNNKISDIILKETESKRANYDCLIYIISGHIKHDIEREKHFLYDTNGEEYPLNNIFDKFNNKNCKELFKKPRIFVLDGFDPNDASNDNIKHRKRILHDLKMSTMVNNGRIEFIHHYKHVIYSNCVGSSFMYNQYHQQNFEGGLLINAFCASLANNYGSNKNGTDSIEIIKQTQSRMNKFGNFHVYHENYVPARCEVLFKTAMDVPVKQTINAQNFGNEILPDKNNIV